MGALAVFLAHIIVGVLSQDIQLVRAACVAMALTAWFVILPFSLALFTTGVVQALGTAWGLLQHYWVAAKLLLTAVATAVLLLKLGPIQRLASAATDRSFTTRDLVDLKASLMVHAGAGVVLLVVTTGLAIYKPAGLTARGVALHRKRNPDLVATFATGTPRWVKRSSVLVLMFLLAVVVLLHDGHGPDQLPICTDLDSHLAWPAVRRLAWA